MDPRLRGFPGSGNGIQLSNQPVSVFPNQNLVAGRFENIFLDQRFRDCRYRQPDPTPINVVSSSTVNHEEDSPEDCDFSDAVLRYINQMLMEEDIEEKNCMLQESLDLQAAEKSFYDVLGKKYPPSPDHSLNYFHQNGESPDGDTSRNLHGYIYGGSDVSSYLIDNNFIQNSGEYFNSQLQSLPLSTMPQSSYSSSNSVITSVDGLVDSPSSSLQLPDWNNESQSIWQFRKGVEEANKFLPSENELFVNLEANRLSSWVPKGETNEVAVKEEKEEVEDVSSNGSRGRKNPYREDVDLEEERSSKQAAIYSESPLRTEMFDMVLLCSGGQSPTVALREALKNASSKTVQQKGQSKGSNGAKGRGKKQSGKKEVVDLRSLLIHCAQAVAADDRRSAHEFLKQIRQHSSPFGDGNQRLAKCFADGLEARLAGTGSQIYKGFVNKRTSAADILKAYQLYLAACPFRKLSNFTANKTIMSLAQNSMRLHIIDFGILYGFQWPTFIQRISMRPGGPPKLRITGIEFPQPGFRPAERVEETGRRLADYAKDFNVPFEYNAIAKRWDTIQLEELKIDRDEVLVVNCLYRAKNLLDETIAVDSSRNIFLNFIRKINPHMFIHGITNGAYNAPFFVTRFREALFHFSAMFDMLETIVPREDRERMVIEKDIFGWEALNVVACEGWERVERPETYKQWQVRNLRAGFVQLPLDRDIVKRATDRVRSGYHKDFVIDEDNRWLLQGWKGRIIYALSAWKPV
ncbi:Scarecrow-like protein 9 [Citrus sinensis]|uniref:Scarecrow-like protein 9 n=1 Tax=Citrus sinensis TaxID=2711 RepID=A0ACB8JTC0_CITSI|nr:Scarecrow-like protein 9 [Citrus sinensis]